MTRVRHVGVGGHADTARLHDHLYLGRRAVSKADGTEYPLDLDSFPQTHAPMDSAYRRALQRSLTATAGVAWSEPREGERAELVAPPLLQRLPDYPRALCHWHRPLAQRWVVGDGRRRHDNPFLMENRRPHEGRAPWEDEDFDGWERAV